MALIYMVLSEYLKKNNIIIKVRARDRWELIEKMLAIAVKNNEVQKEDEELIKKALIDREKSMSTGIGRGVAIPHCTTAKVEDVVIVLATSVNGIDFDSIDSLPVKIAILLIVPKNKLTQHIKTLANIARVMGNDKLREDLLSLGSSEKILKTIKDYEIPAKK
jgi:fructose-specific phosphotransferase system IIA component